MPKYTAAGTGAALDTLVADQKGTGTATAAIATASITGVPGQRIYITQLSVGASGAAITATGLAIAVLDGATTIWNGSTATQTTQVYNFNPPLQCTVGNGASATLAAGPASCVGAINLVGYAA